MKINLNHSFLFNIQILCCDVSLQKQITDVVKMWCEQTTVHVVACIFDLFCILYQYYESHTQQSSYKKKSCTWGAAECVTQGGERGRLIYIYRGGGHYILCKRIIQINVQKTIISALGMAISFLGQKGVTVFLQEIQGEDIRKNQ